MLEALPKFHFSGYAGGAAQIPQVNAINDKSFTIAARPSSGMDS
jgi:hypothetical protein